MSYLQTITEHSLDTLTTHADTLATHGQKGGSDWILHHVQDAAYLDFEPFGTIQLPHIELFGLDISITKHVFFMWVVSLVLLVVLAVSAGRYKKSLVPKGISNLFEMIILFVRDEIVRPTIGKDAEKFLPYLLNDPPD